MRSVQIQTRRHKTTGEWAAFLVPYKDNDPIGVGPHEADAVYDLFLEIAEREENAD